MKNINEEVKKSISNLLSEAKDGITVAEGLINRQLFKDAIIQSWSAAEKALTSIWIFSGITKPEATHKESICIELSDLVEGLPDDEPEIKFVKNLYNNATSLENIFQKINTKANFSQRDAVNAFENSKAIVLEIEKHLYTKICGH